MTTLLEVIQKGTAYLEKMQVDSPRLTMELLAAHALEMQRMELYLNFERLLNGDELGVLRSLLKKRGSRIPLQHLIGTVEFYGRIFYSDARALIPRPETEELVSHVLQLPLPTSPRILDLCCGSGVIGLTLKEELPGATVTLADLSAEALDLARKNAKFLNVDVHIQTSDLFADLSSNYDLIVCNPPYVSESAKLEPELSYDPSLALFSGADGLDLIRKIIPGAAQYLAPMGWLALEIGYDMGIKSVRFFSCTSIPEYASSTAFRL